MMEKILVSLLFLVLIFPHFQANELIVGSEQHGVATLTPCTNDTDCEDFLNATCTNEFCECSNSKFCEEKVVRVVTKIGEFCKIKADCNIEHSSCKDNKCTCEEGLVVASDQRRCLKISDQPCIDLLSCNGIDPENNQSTCVTGRCECEEERPYCTSSVKKSIHEKLKKLVKPPKAAKPESDENTRLGVPSVPSKQFFRENPFFVYSCAVSSNYLIYKLTNDRGKILFRRYIIPVQFYLMVVYTLWIVDVNDSFMTINQLLFLSLMCGGIIGFLLFLIYLIAMTLYRHYAGVEQNIAHRQPHHEHQYVVEPIRRRQRRR